MNNAVIIFNNVTAEFVEVGPKLAAAFLEKNKKNRRIDSNRVAKYAADMNQGYWCFNGDAIRFDVNGTLIDGQHRLSALIKADKSYCFLVIKNVVEESKRTIDTGKSRSGGDILSMFSDVGTRDSGVLSAAISMIILYKKGVTLSSGGGHSLYTTNSCIEVFYKENYKKLNSSLNFLSEVLDTHMMLLSRSESLFLHYIFSEIDQDEADNFIKKVSTGAGIEISSNEHMFRNMLTKRAIKTLKITKTEVIFTAIRAWNRTRKGGNYSTESNLKFGKEDALKGYPVAI